MKKASCLGVGVCLVIGFFLSGHDSGATATATATVQGRTRTFEFDYRLEIPADDLRKEPMHLFVPIVVEDEAQRILEFDVDAPLSGNVETEPVYGNRYWHGIVPPNPDRSISIVFRYQVERETVRAGERNATKGGLSRFLRSNEKVVVGHPILDPILEEIRAASPDTDPAVRSRAIYDWVVENVEYKKVGSGWGNGDTFWACNERYGNCTDFHSLFISLARTEGIPARFEMGFPIPLDRKEGKISGYHCWVEFWLPGVGWFPIDASEAFKHPDKRDLFYGTHPADRVHFSTGRDIRLGPHHRDRALNYFVYPYAEVAGRRSALPIVTEFHYRDLVPTE